jgi:hypothetical protein
VDPLWRHWYPTIRTDTVVHMNNQGRVKPIARDVIGSFCSQLKALAFKLYCIRSPIDSKDFFEQVRSAYPLDPAISGDVNWDAFADSIWGGLDACPDLKIALVINDVTVFRESNYQEFEVALDCLQTAATEVEAEKRNRGQNEAEIIIVIGI